MSENKEISSNVNESSKKRKSRFGMVLSVVIVILAMIFSYLALNQKENYAVLSSTSKEVTSKIGTIKDYRKIKGYKVLEDTGKHKLILISAGLTYDELATIEVASVEFNKNKINVSINEKINENPEREVEHYPFLILKVESSVSDITIKNQLGEQYNEIIIDGEPLEDKKIENEDSESTQKEDENDENIEVEDVTETEENVEEDVKEEDDKSNQEQPSEDVKELTCVYRGRVDSNSIEVSVGDSYRTLNVDMAQDAFVDKEIGETIIIEYIESSIGQKVVRVK